MLEVAVMRAQLSRAGILILIRQATYQNQASSTEAAKGAVLMAMLQDGFNRRRNGQEVTWLRKQRQGGGATSSCGHVRTCGAQQQRAPAGGPSLRALAGPAGTSALLLGAPDTRTLPANACAPQLRAFAGANQDGAVDAQTW